MTPDEAQWMLDVANVVGPNQIGDPDMIKALRTVAGLRVEEEWQIVPTDSNGGKYETRRYTRLVSEWTPDER